MSTTATQEQAAAEDTAQKPDSKKKKTRIARWALPDIDENSALLPPDKWIIDSLKGFAKDSQSFKKTVSRMTAFAAGALVTLGAGIVAAVIVFPALVPLAVVAGVSLLTTGLFGKLANDNVKKFKTETLPDLRKDMGKKYLEFKMGELKAAWQQKMDARQKQKAAAKASKEAEASKPAAKAEAIPADKPAPEAQKPAEKPAEIKEEQAVAAPDTKKPEEKKSIGGTIGGWVLKKAMEKTQKRKSDDEPPAAAPEKPKPEQPPKP